MCWALHHFLDLPRMFMTIYLQQSNVYKTLKRTYQTQIHKHVLSIPDTGHRERQGSESALNPSE